MIEVENTILVGGDTPRTRIYLQCLRYLGIRLAGVFIFMNKTDRQEPTDQQSKWTVGESNERFAGLKLDLSVPVAVTARLVSTQVKVEKGASINCEKVVDSLSEFSSTLESIELIAYSGYGGEIVTSSTLDIFPPFLHIHSGWLPKYRGSTTVYYSLLDGMQCGVSAILLSEKIDQGVIVGRKWFEAPAVGEDIDLFYDSLIRADLLIAVLQEYSRSGRFPEFQKQVAEIGIDHFVIHPVLKHIAILSLDKDLDSGR